MDVSFKFSFDFLYQSRPNFVQVTSEQAANSVPKWLQWVNFIYPNGKKRQESSELSSSATAARGAESSDKALKDPQGTPPVASHTQRSVQRPHPPLVFTTLPLAKASLYRKDLFPHGTWRGVAILLHWIHREGACGNALALVPERWPRRPPLGAQILILALPATSQGGAVLHGGGEGRAILLHRSTERGRVAMRWRLSRGAGGAGSDSTHISVAECSRAEQGDLLARKTLGCPGSCTAPIVLALSPALPPPLSFSRSHRHPLQPPPPSKFSP